MRITINMPEETLNAYRAAAESRNTTIAAVMRDALAAFIPRSQPPPGDPADAALQRVADLPHGESA